MTTYPEHPGATEPGPEPAVADGETSTAVQRLRFVVIAGLAGAVAGLVTGFLWPRLSGPPSLVVQAEGAIYTETAWNAESVSNLWFFVIGVVVGTVAGLVLGLLGYRHGLVTLVAVVACCVAGALVMRLFGSHVFGPNVDEQAAAGLQQGDRLYLELKLSSPVVMSGWLIGGLLGCVAAVSGWPRPSEQADSAPAAS